MKYKFRSNAERRVAEWFTKNGIKFNYEAQKIPYTSTVRNGLCPKCGNKGALQRRTYLADFSFPDYPFLLEFKGKLSPPERSKLLDIRRSNPQLNLKLLLMRDNKLRKNSEKRYSTWCVENGFDFSVGYPPKRWFTKI